MPDQRQVMPLTSHCRWLRQSLRLLQQRREQSWTVCVAAAEGKAASASQEPTQELKSSWQTFWSPGRQTEGTSRQSATEQRLTHA
jgi:hypothetical protein